MRFLSFGVCHSVAKLCARWASVRFRRTRSSSFRCFGIYNLSRMLSSYLPNRYISTANVHHHTRLEGPYRADGRSLRGQQTPVSGATPPRIAGALRPAPRASCTPRALHVPRDSVVYSGCSPPNGARLTRSTPRIPRTLPTLARKRGERKAAFSAILRHRAKPPPPGSARSPTSASSLSAIHQPELRLPPIIAISRGVHQFAAFPSASSCASIAKSLSPKRREDLSSFHLLCPCASRA